MVKRILIVVLFLAAAISQAQFRWNDVSLYYQAGIYNASILNPNQYSEEIDLRIPTIRGSGGLGVMYNFNDRFAFSFGADYERKGQQFEGFGRGEVITRDYILDYLSGNLMFRYFGKHFNVGVGGYYSYLFSETIRFKNDIEHGTIRFKNDDFFYNDDAGLILELGWIFDLDYRTKANVSLFGSYGLLDINRSRYQFNRFGDEYHAAQNLVVGIRATIFIITQPY